MGFIEDSTGQTNNVLANLQPGPVALLQQTVVALQARNAVLQVSGGLLKLNKCSYHHIH